MATKAAAAAISPFPNDKEALHNVEKAKRLADSKNYKEGLRLIEKVLSKHPHYAEATILKAILTMNSCTPTQLELPSKREEILRLGIRAVELDKESWWIRERLTLIQRQFRMYEDAEKQTAAALKRFERNPTGYMSIASGQAQDRKIVMLKEYSQSLVHLRKHPQNVEVRKQLLQIESHRPVIGVGATAAKLGLAVAQHLSGNLKEALELLLEYQTIVEPTLAPGDKTELVAYRAQLVAELGNPAVAIAYLKEQPHATLFLEIIASLELSLERYDEALSTYRRLLTESDSSSDNHEHHRGFQCALMRDIRPLTALKGTPRLPAENLSEPMLSLFDKEYDALAALYPKSPAIKRIRLMFCDDARFPEKIKAFLTQELPRGVPALFSTLKAFPRPRMLAMEKVVRELLVERADCGWTLHFAAQLLDHLSPGNEEALALCDRVATLFADSPDDLIESLRVKARVLKHAGDVSTTFQLLEEARKKDLKDRYINNKAAKYALRSGRPDEAVAIVNLFARPDDAKGSTDPITIRNYQYSWFELEEGHAYARMQKWRMAYKSYWWVRKNYDTYEDDQFDFHEYCVRKGTPRSYVALVRMEDRLRSARVFREAAKGAVTVLLAVADGKYEFSEVEKHVSAREKAAAKAAAEEAARLKQLEDMEGLSAREKARLKKQRAKEKADREAAEKEAAEKAEAEALAQQGGEGDAASATTAAAKKTTTTASSGRHADQLVADHDPEGWSYFEELKSAPEGPRQAAIREARGWIKFLKTPVQVWQAGTSAESATTLALTFDAAIRRETATRSLDSCLQCLETLAVMKSGAAKARLLERVIPFARFAALGSAKAYPAWCPGEVDAFALSPASKAKLDGLVASLTASKPLMEWAWEQVEKGEDLEVVEACAKGLLTADPERADVAAVLTSKCLGEYRRAVRVLTEILEERDFARRKSGLPADDVSGAFRRAVKAKWPRSNLVA